jgi:hypothetical protein
MAGTPSIGAGLAAPTCSPMGYQAVPASQTTQALGPAGGAVGDYLHGLLIVPATTAAGTVSIKDGTGSAVNVFVTGTLSDTRSFFLPISMKSVNGAWQITTGANVSVLAVGSFT